VKAFVVAGKDLLVAARDTKALIMLLLMPFLLVAVLGFSLGSFMGAGPLPAVEPFDVGIVDRTGAICPACSDRSSKPRPWGVWRRPSNYPRPGRGISSAAGNWREP